MPSKRYWETHASAVILSARESSRLVISPGYSFIVISKESVSCACFWLILITYRLALVLSRPDGFTFLQGPLRGPWEIRCSLTRALLQSTSLRFNAGTLLASGYIVGIAYEVTKSGAWLESTEHT